MRKHGLISRIEDCTIIEPLICVIICYDVERWNAFSSKSDSLYKRHKLYLKGLDKFSQEIDILYYTKSLRLLKTLLSSLMDDSEKYLSMYQHQNCLKMIDWDLCQDETPEEHQIPKLTSNETMIELHHTHVNEFFRSYLEEKFTAKDYRLLKGVFWEQDLKNDELKLIYSEDKNSEDSMSSNYPIRTEQDLLINSVIQDHKGA